MCWTTEVFWCRVTGLSKCPVCLPTATQPCVISGTCDVGINPARCAFGQLKPIIRGLSDAHFRPQRYPLCRKGVIMSQILKTQTLGSTAAPFPIPNNKGSTSPPSHQLHTRPLPSLNRSHTVSPGNPCHLIIVGCKTRPSLTSFISSPIASDAHSILSCWQEIVERGENRRFPSLQFTVELSSILV